MDLALPASHRQRVGLVLVVLAVFGGGIGATRAWDAWQTHQAQHAGLPALIEAINILMATSPKATAEFQRRFGNVVVPTLQPANTAETPAPSAPPEAAADDPPIEEEDADAAPIDPV